MPKKIKTSSKAVNDFHFIVVMSVFAALTIFAASYVGNVRKQLQAKRQTILNVSQLDMAEPRPWPTPRLKNHK